MTDRTKAILWAIAIICAAWIAKSYGASDAASFTLVTGLSAAAVTSFRARKSRVKGRC